MLRNRHWTESRCATAQNSAETCIPCRCVVPHLIAIAEMAGKMGATLIGVR